VKRLIATLVLVLAATFVEGCGGRTGLNVRVDVPGALHPGVDFDHLYFQVETELGTKGETYSITQATAQPYRVIVWGEDGKTFKAQLRVQLLTGPDVIPNGEKRVPDVPFVDGELKEVVIALNE
jgi:hypothetical protein